MTKIKNPSDFASALLGQLGLPNDKTNVANLVGWESLEGGNWNNTAKYNPLNTSEQETGSVNYDTGQPGSGVQAYGNWDQGLNATVQTLQDSNPAYGYSQILADLGNSTDWPTFLTSLQSSSWDAGRYAGVASTKVPPSSSGSDPNASAYQSGSSTAQQNNVKSNLPSPTKGAQHLPGLGGVLQQLDELYNPGGFNSTLFGIIPNIPKDISNVATMIFVRATSAILSVGVLIMGIKLLTSGSSGSGSSGGNVLEFVNNAQLNNKKMNLAEQRISAAAEKEIHVERRSQRRSADYAATNESRERVAATPRTSYRYGRTHATRESYQDHRSTNIKYSESHIHHHSDRPRRNNKKTTQGEIDA